MSAQVQEKTSPAEALPIHVLIVDDEAAVRDAYRDTLMPKAPSGAATEMANLRAQLFGKKAGSPQSPGLVVPAAPVAAPAPRFEPQFASNAREAVDMVAANLARGVHFSTVFLDMRMPPGENGLWAAEHIRHLDADVDIVICSAYSDVEPATVIERVPPADRLFFLQKPFHPHEVRQLARALGAKRNAQAHVHKLAYYDPLTGLANRANFRESVGKDLRREALPEGGAAVLFIDLDHFKRINDQYGHAAGDAVLCTLARLSGSCFRSIDTVGRLGGEEFAVLLPGADLQCAAQAARRLAQRLAETPVEHEGQRIVAGMTAGVVQRLPGEHSLDSLLQRADLALYAGKQAGRARTMLALPDGSHQEFYTGLHSIG